jgi:hypothetical protein
MHQKQSARRGRKPLGDRAMTDAERQRKRRERLRQAKKDSVTAARHEIEDATKKRIAWLEKENKRLRKDVKDWQRLHGDAVALRDKLMREQYQQLEDLKAGREDPEIHRLAKEKAQLSVEVLRLRMEKQQLELEAILKPPILKKWFADLSKRFHPDRGGSEEQMKVVNEAHTLLLALLKPS